MLSIDPKAISIPKLHGYLLSAIAPRPIAFASTVDADGNPNLSPFSFFNVFSANPPVMIFSPARRVRDNTVKHTLENADQTREVVINVVSYAMVQQMSLSSTEYPRGVNEFIKSGFTMLPSELVKPYRVAESPVQFECRVQDIVAMGTGGGAGNLIICEVLRMHIATHVLDADNRIDPYKIDLVSRMGADWYCRSVMGMFEVPKPLSSVGIGVDAIPENIRKSDVLTGNDLGKLGNVDRLPGKPEIEAFINASADLQTILKTNDQRQLHESARACLEQDDVLSAWKTLLAATV
ncbi:MAG: flavin reductase family protein [Sinomicrobium sp.]|nr:flavin reductase family protein [Sinomicrobium sp.]